MFAQGSFLSDQDMEAVNSRAIARKAENGEYGAVKIDDAVAAIARVL